MNIEQLKQILDNAPNLEWQSYLKECFDYYADSGELKWKSRPLSHFKDERSMKIFNTRRAGKSVKPQKDKHSATAYIRFKLNGKDYYAHRIIWVIVYGYEPSSIDHINGNGSDNRLQNLREVTKKVNNRNRPKQKNNKSGVNGVHWCGVRNKWKVEIMSDSKRVYVGRFDTLEEASKARKDAEKRFGYHKNHGR